MDFTENSVMFNVDTVSMEMHAINVMDIATMGVNLTLTEQDVIVSDNKWANTIYS